MAFFVGTGARLGLSSENRDRQPLTERQILLTSITPANTTAPATIPATALSRLGTTHDQPPMLWLTPSIQ